MDLATILDLKKAEISKVVYGEVNNGVAPGLMVYVLNSLVTELRELQHTQVVTELSQVSEKLDALEKEGEPDGKHTEGDS